MESSITELVRAQCRREIDGAHDSEKGQAELLRAQAEHLRAETARRQLELEERRLEMERAEREEERKMRRDRDDLLNTLLKRHLFESNK